MYSHTTSLLRCTYTSACTTCMLWTTFWSDHCQHAPPTPTLSHTASLTRGGLTNRWIHWEGVCCPSVWKPRRAHWRGRKKIFRQCRKGTTCRYAIYQLTHLHTKVHSSHTNLYPAHNSHEATPVVGEHTERLPAVPVGGHCAGFVGVGKTAAVKGNRATHLKLCADTEKRWQFGTTP